MSRLVKQQGLSALSLLIVLMVSAFFLNCAIHLIPLYVDNMSVHSALSSLAKDPALSTLGKSEIHQKLSKNFDMNNVQNKIAQAVSIEKTVATTFININYEERVHIIFNIDAVVRFENQLDIKRPDLCCDPQ